MLKNLQRGFTRQNLLDGAKFFALLNLGLVATAVGIALFKTPNHFAFGGTSGLSIVLSTLFPQWNVGFFMWIVNAALVLLGFLFLGVRSMGWTIYSSFALSFYVSVCEHIWPLARPADQRRVPGTVLRRHPARSGQRHRVQHRRVHRRHRHRGHDPAQVHQPGDRPRTAHQRPGHRAGGRSALRPRHRAVLHSGHDPENHRGGRRHREHQPGAKSAR